MKLKLGDTVHILRFTHKRLPKLKTGEICRVKQITKTYKFNPPSTNIKYLYSYTRSENTLTFTDQDSLIAVYLEIFNRTAVTQPLGSNIGYSIGVGTILRDLTQELYFKINDQLMVTWRLVEQITSQSDIPVGGDSPDGTIGYVTVLENWPDPLPNSYLDLALIIDYKY